MDETGGTSVMQDPSVSACTGKHACYAWWLHGGCMVAAFDDPVSDRS